MCRSFVWHFLKTEDHIGRFDVVHGHDWMAANAVGWIKDGRPDHRAVFTMHSTEYGRAGNVFHNGASQRIRDLEAYGTARADRVIAVSHALKGELGWIYKVPDWKTRVVYNGVSVHRFDGWIDPGAVKRRWGVGPMDPTVLFMGRLSVQKGPDILLEAIPHLLKYYPNAKFIFAGEGHLRGDLERRVHELKVAHAVRWFGRLGPSEQSDMFRACDVVCVPSRNEPFGIIVLEAWAAGKPVVASKVGGPNEIVRHAENGLKIQPSTDSVGWGLGTLFTNWDWARSMGRRGRVDAEAHFSWDRIAETTERCYAA
jgi:glycosyltransferase involved in cell wall biosynthesis